MVETSKSCSKCGETKLLSAFHKGNSAHGRQSWCKRCQTAMMLTWRQNNRVRANELSRQSAARNRPKRIAYFKTYYQKNRTRELAQAKARNQVLKDMAYAAYGGYRCACCGETTPAFLSFDHVNNDGGKHRKEIGRGSRIYVWMKKRGYPKGFQILCHNCNHGRSINGGTCPHFEAQYGRKILET